MHFELSYIIISWENNKNTKQISNKEKNPFMLNIYDSIPIES